MNVMRIALSWLIATSLSLVFGMCIVGWFLEILTSRRRNLSMLIDTVISAARQNLPIIDALKAVAEDARGIFRRQLESALSLAHEGLPLGEALRSRRGYFPGNVCNMLAAGEKYGNMKLFATHLRDMFIDTMSFREDAAQNLIYPFFVSACITPLFCVIFLVVMPQFRTMFEEMNTAMPPITAFVFQYGSVILPVLLVIPTAAFFVILFSGTSGTMLRRKFKPIASIADGVVARIPYIGTIVKKASYAQFAHSVGALLQCGMPLHEAVGASLDMDLNAIVKRRLQETHTALSDGMSFGESLRAAGVPDDVCWFAETGEGTAMLSDNMMRVAELYRANVGTALKASSKVIVPLTVIPLAAACAVIVLAIWSPFMAIITGELGAA